MAGDMDMQAHRATYETVMKLMFRGTIGCAIIAAVVIWLIA